MSNSLVLFCRLCATGFLATGEIPVQCPACQKPTAWTTFKPIEPSQPYTLTKDDARFLVSIRVRSD